MSQPTSRTVLGVDPGLTRCGIGVVKGSAGAQLELVDVGVIQTSPSLPLEQRLLELEASLIEWFDKYSPDVIAVERVFSQHNVRTVMGTGQAAGIALLLAAKRGIPVVMHTPSEVKAAVTGNGRANKSQVADMVVRILSLKEAPKPVDSTDALALAICNIWRGSATSKIDQALRAEKTRISKIGEEMIAQLTGSVRSINTDRIILEVAGVGYLIHVTPTAAATLTLGNSLTIHTSMVVREDSMTLYGFIDAPSRETFELVQTVSGIGPRVALSILAHLSPDQLADAVESESVNILSGVPGIGKKGAQRILLELKGKLSRTGTSGARASSSQPLWRGQLSGALISLGYSAREADSTISIVAIDYANRGLDPAHSDLSELLKAALAGGKS